MKQSRKKFAILALFSMFLSVAGNLSFINPVETENFDPGFLFSDAELQDTTSMGEADIQKFLEQKNSYLAAFEAPDAEGKIKRASTIIYDAAVRYQINPRYILALFQKEQSLIEGVPENKLQDRLDWAAGYGVCDSCSKSDPEIQKFKGFGKQADYAAGANRYYFDNPRKFGFKINQAIIVDGISFVPRTQATVNQYIYTPHIHGNKNLLSIWTKWFSRLFPNGTIVQANGEKAVYVIKNGYLQPFANYASFISRYSDEDIIQVNQSDLTNYPVGATIKFPNYSLLRSPNGFVYLLIDDSIRPFASAELVRKIGYHPDEIIDVSLDDLKPYRAGKFITIADAYPTGAVLKNKNSGQLYYVFEGTRTPLMGEFVAKNKFANLPLIEVSPDTLKDIPIKLDKVYLKDGTIIKTDISADIFVISDGLRRHITNEKAFNALGFKLENVKNVDEFTLMMHPEGNPVYAPGEEPKTLNAATDNTK